MASNPSRQQRTSRRTPSALLVGFTLAGCLVAGLAGGGGAPGAAATTSPVPTNPAHPGPSASSTEWPSTADRILGWILSEDFPDLSGWPTWLEPLPADRCLLVSPLPCP